MTAADVPDAARVSDEGFFELDTRMQRVSGPPPERRSDPHRAVWTTRTLHLLTTDPGGCWVAEDDTGIVGMATSYRRETLWCLATYAVLPGRQGHGIGRPLLAAALCHWGRDGDVVRRWAAVDVLGGGRPVGTIGWSSTLADALKLGAAG